MNTMKGMNMTYRHETHHRFENFRLIDAVIGRRSWEDDDANAGGVVSRYPTLADARRDADRLAAQGLQVSWSRGNEGEPDAGKGYLWVIVGDDK